MFTQEDARDLTIKKKLETVFTAIRSAAWAGEIETTLLLSQEEAFLLRTLHYRVTFVEEAEPVGTIKAVVFWGLE